MTETSFPAVFMRGGTSKAVMFHAHDLPADRTAWDPIFLAAMGSPDPNGRQLDGMGGGISSLSKICVLAPSSHEDADIDYTFAQVLIREPHVDYKGNCGNMSSAVGPFAVDERLVRADRDSTTVRIFNTNTAKLIHATFPVRHGRARYDGTLQIPGVAGTGAAIKLDFLDPGGATTGVLLPTGNVVDRLDVPGIGPIDVSMVDAANACAFVRAADLGLSGTELPDALDAASEVLARLAAIRIQASIAMGIAQDAAKATAITSVPYIGFVSAAANALTLNKQLLAAEDMDFAARVISNGQPHRALPLTASLCLAVAARLEGSLVAEMLRQAPASDQALRIGMPSGVLTVAADVSQNEEGKWLAHSGSFYRTARRLFDGRVYVS
jgi:2-methylaconitate isomerase